MLFTGYADVIDPRRWSFLALSGYAFPVFFLANIVMLMVWACVRLRLLAIPFTGFLICFVPAMKYCPVNPGASPEEGCLKVMSFNTWEYGTESLGLPKPKEEDERLRRETLQYIADSDCDIVCLQESSFYGDTPKLVDEIIRRQMPYVDTCRGRGSSLLLVISKYPIIRHELIEYETIANISAAFYLDINGRKVTLINNHLETNRFTVEEKAQFGVMVKGDMERDQVKSESKFVLKKLANAAVIRASQADSVASFVARHKGEDIILCGDFNDIPVSYVHRTIQGDLTDCYISAGRGLGFSYRKNGMYVRIDNIMCTDSFTPCYTFVDSSIGISDHFPIITYLK